jgi:hypothetical protein
MQTDINDSTIYLRYNSWQEFVNDVEACPLGPNARYQLSRSTQVDSWTGDLSWEDAVSLAKSGWTEGAERIRNLLTPLYNQLAQESFLPQIVNDIEGDSIDIGAFLSGEPEAFLRWEDSEILNPNAKNNRHVRIGYNISASGGFSAHDLFVRGAYVCALVDMLESHGRRVDVDLYDGTKKLERKLFVKIQLKRAEDPLDLEKLAFALCNPATLRRLLFSKEESLPHPWYILTYAFPADPPDLDADIILNAGVFQGASMDMTQWVKDLLASQGVEFLD